MEIVILRLGHRLPRDERISTHVALVARAFGADRMIYSGQHDGGLESSVLSLVSGWGGKFNIKYEKNFRKVIKEYKKEGFVIVHLTFYGIPLPEALPELKTRNSKLGTPATGHCKLLLVVGSEAVPGDIFELADFNIAVTSQPHSEVAALAILLDRLQGGKELERDFEERFKGKISVEPTRKGKKIIETGDWELETEH